jgi:hypothetical protein
MAHAVIPINISIRALVGHVPSFRITISVRCKAIAVRASILFGPFFIAIAVNAQVITWRAGEALCIITLRAIAAIGILPTFLMAQVIIPKHVSLRARVAFCAVGIAEAVGPQIITLLAGYALPVVAL